MEALLNFLLSGRHVACLVGGGGKTTLLYELAGKLAQQGRRVVVLTSTHILQPEKEIFAHNAKEARHLWGQSAFAVIGTPEAATGKLTGPAPELYSALAPLADVVLCEADGAKHLPAKVPAAHEPVILPACDIVVAVCGLDALGKPLAQAVFRAPLAAQLLNTHEKALLTAAQLAHILTSAQGARKNVGKREYFVVLNKCDLVNPAQVEEVREAVLKRGIPVNRVLMR